MTLAKSILCGLVAGFLVVGLPGLTQASCRARAVVVNRAVVVKEVVAVAAVAQFVAVPVVAVGYSPYYAPPAAGYTYPQPAPYTAPDPCAEKIKALELRLRQLESGGKPAPTPAPGPAPAPAPGPQGKQSGGLDLSDLAKLTETQRLKAFLLVNSGEMPKEGKPVSDADSQLFQAFAKDGKATPQLAAVVQARCVKCH